MSGVRSFFCLVGLGGVDGELGWEFAVLVPDACVAVGDAEHDAGVGASRGPAVLISSGRSRRLLDQWEVLIWSASCATDATVVRPVGPTRRSS